MAPPAGYGAPVYRSRNGARGDQPGTAPRSTDRGTEPGATSLQGQARTRKDEGIRCMAAA